MTHIVWRNEYSINISRIDDQHQNLARLVNELNESVELGAEMKVLRKQLSELIVTTRIHFDTEEDLMRSHGYPDYSNHKVEHDALISYLEDTESRLSVGVVDTFLTNFNVSCDCFIIHMNERDKKLGAFLNRRDIY
ncbi:MAG: bacteriohemerythrin [gamma proteobacterium endosymbiont of Lamellibrachia anaximandri]|nr:bacteriohemerythrin [gamma proteobacterium endosymbiont of Lamellibrachia anaximandri]MBL3619351.1 bacteriohemerythrin [gamma proteobacterium endosymbiont of Lamellibrachia anaximandri]